MFIRCILKCTLLFLLSNIPLAFGDRNVSNSHVEIDSVSLAFIKKNIAVYNVINDNIGAKTHGKFLAIEAFDLSKHNFLGIPRWNEDMLIEHRKISETYPEDDYILYEFSGAFNKFIIRNAANINNDRRYRLYENTFNNTRRPKWLVAYNPLTCDVKCISGLFYKHSISSDFNLRIDEPTSFYKYIKLKVWAQSDLDRMVYRTVLDSISYVKHLSNDQYLHYRGYSDKDSFNIVINTVFPEIVNASKL